MSDTPTTSLEKKSELPKEVSPSLTKLKNQTLKIIDSDTPDEYIAKAGIDLLDIYKELGAIALGAVINVRDKYGDVIELGADNRARTTAIALILELKKHLKDKSTIQQVALFDSGAIEDAKRVLRLKDRDL